LCFAIVHKVSEELIGEISFHLDNFKNIAQPGYWIGEPFWRKGFKTEAMEAVLKFRWEKLNLDVIYGECPCENKASEKVLLKNRMKRNSVNGSVVQYRLTKQEFE
jgi:RimJ/RimL family protein N-acetyltransferase